MVRELELELSNTGLEPFRQIMGNVWQDELVSRRRQIFMQIRRRQREARRHGSREGPTDPILRYMTYPY